MKTLKHTRPTPQMALSARTAADLMTPNPLSIRYSATVSEAAAFLAARGISAAPVIDDAGRPVGVVSSTDILIHKGQGSLYLVGSSEYDERPTASANNAPEAGNRCLLVADVMTPIVFCVRPETAAAKVVEKLLALKVRRLFVVDADGVLTGVISLFDVLWNLRRYGPDAAGHASELCAT